MFFLLAPHATGGSTPLMAPVQTPPKHLARLNPYGSACILWQGRCHREPSRRSIMKSREDLRLEAVGCRGADVQD